MVSCVKVDALVFLQLRIDVNRQAEEITERWHGANLAARKQAQELALRREPYLFRPKCNPYLRKANQPACRQDRHNVRPIGLQNDNLSHLPTWNVLPLCDLL